MSTPQRESESFVFFSFYARESQADELRGYVVQRLIGGERVTISEVVRSAIDAELRRLRAAHNGGRPFKRPGRPVPHAGKVVTNAG